jgi:hypothetical protein
MVSALTMVNALVLHACPSGQTEAGLHQVPNTPLSQPTTQEVQFAREMAPASEYGLVAGQGVHNAAPASPLKRPGGHSSQVPAPGMVPGAQITWKRHAMGMPKSGPCLQYGSQMRDSCIASARTFVCVATSQP